MKRETATQPISTKRGASPAKVESTEERQQGLGLDLAYDYLRIHYIQDAIWTLQQIGDSSTATRLQEKYATYLSQAEVIGTRGGPRNGSILNFKGALAGVFKTAGTYDNAEAEIWAYHLSEALGLNIVPLTVKRVEKGKEGSVQAFMYDVVAGGINFRDGVYTEGYVKLYALDYILFNKDRNHSNFLKRQEVDGGLIAIDHGLTYSPPGGINTEWLTYPIGTAQYLNTLPTLLNGTPTLEKITSISDDDLRKALAPYVPSAVIDYYIGRRAELLGKLEINAAEIKTKRRLEYIPGPNSAMPALAPCPAVMGME